MDDEPIVKTPKTWTADQRYELFGTDRYLNLWLNRGKKRRFPAWHFEYEGFSGRVKAVFHDERVLIEIHGYKEESGSTFGFKLRWKVPRRLRGKDVMVWGDPVYPFTEDGIDDKNVLDRMEEWMGLGPDGILVKLAMLEAL